MPEIIPIISIALAGVGVGETLYSAANKPGIPKVNTTTPPQSSTTNAAQKASVSQALPTLQALTGGSLSPEYAAQFGATQAGVANNPQASGNVQAAINQFFGLTAPGTTGLTSSGSTTGSTPSIIDMLNKGGGSSAPSLTGGGGGSLVDSLLSGDTFKGLVAA